MIQGTVAIMHQALGDQTVEEGEQTIVYPAGV